MTPRAFAYLRISHDPRRISLSPQRQRSEIERVAAAKGLNVTEWFEERDRSAYRAVKRPVFDEMLARLHEANVLFVWEVSRLARRLVKGAELLDRLEELGVRLVSVTEGDSEEVPRFVLEVMFSLAAQESREKSRRVSLAHQYTALKLGQPVSAHRMYGYNYDPASKSLEIHAEEARVVRLIFERYLTGAGDAQIARELNDGRLAGAPVPPLRGQAWGTSSVARLLTSPIRAGLVTYKSRVVGDGIPAIVDQQMWDAVQATRSIRRRAQRRPSRSEGHLLYGIVRCAGCGGPMSVNDPGRWGSYRCTRGYDSGLPCEERATMSRAWLDDYAQKWFFDHIDREDVAARRRSADEQDSPNQALRSEKARLEAAMTRLRDAYAVHSEVSLDIYRQGVDEIEGHLEIVQEKIRASEEGRVLKAAIPPRSVDALWPYFTIPEKRTALGAYIDRIEVRRRPRGVGPSDDWVSLTERLT